MEIREAIFYIYRMGVEHALRTQPPAPPLPSFGPLCFLHSFASSFMSCLDALGYFSAAVIKYFLQMQLWAGKDLLSLVLP